MNYIFDFGQVIVHFDLDYMTGAYIDNKADIDLAKDVIFDRLYWDRLDGGTIADSEVRQEICRRLPERLHESALLTYDNWFRNLPFIEGMPEIIRDLKARGDKVYLLSNISERFADEYKSVPPLCELLSLFDGLVFSAPIGLVKPHSDIFRHLLDTYSLSPEDCLFIDDRADNIEGGEAVGIKGYLFDGDSARFREFIFNA